MSKKRYQHILEINILKHYAWGTTGLFVGLLLYLVLSNPLENFFGEIFQGLQFYSMPIFMGVLASSMAGAIFHQVVKYRPKSRNAFAFVFSMTSLKFLGTLVVFQLLG